MEFYKVKKESDQIRVFKNGKYNGFLIANELVTKRELLKLWGSLKVFHYDLVSISKQKTYWFCGARFENRVEI